MAKKDKKEMVEEVEEEVLEEEPVPEPTPEPEPEPKNTGKKVIREKLGIGYKIVKYADGTNEKFYD
jgi:hypothetical protein